MFGFFARLAQKKEAISRMKLLGINSDIIEDFKDNSFPHIYEPPFGASYSINEEEDKVLFNEIGRLKARGMLVWGVIRCSMPYNRKPVTIDCMLFVSKNKKEWPAERRDLFGGYPFVYTCCKEVPSLHDHGCIPIYMSEGGTPLRMMP